MQILSTYFGLNRRAGSGRHAFEESWIPLAQDEAADVYAVLKGCASLHVALPGGKEHDGHGCYISLRR